MDSKKLGERIKITRKKLGITSEKLADACYLNATYMRQIENGAKTPSLSVFVLICQVLKVSPSYLLIDELPGSEAWESEELFELWRRATPSELRIITNIVKSALESLREG